jgi:hypothetical protein
MIIRLLECLIFSVIFIPLMLLFSDVVEGRAFRNKHQYGRLTYNLASGIEIICNLILYGFILVIIYHVALAMVNK